MGFSFFRKGRFPINYMINSCRYYSYSQQIHPGLSNGKKQNKKQPLSSNFISKYEHCPALWHAY